MAKKITNVPPVELKRNEYGLLENINYEFDENGFVDYRKLIPAEFLVPNRQIFIKKDMPVPKSIEELEDNQILVLLGGWKWLAKVRGFKSVEHQVVEIVHGSVTIKTTVCWRGNYETNNEDICFSALATASVANTHNFALNYLAEIAENRGFSRAVRGFLNISLVGKDEIGPEEDEKNQQASELQPNQPHGILQKKLQERGVSFETFKDKYIKKGHAEAEEWNSISDIPLKEVWVILELIKKQTK